jgi:hypothetical protein
MADTVRDGTSRPGEKNHDAKLTAQQVLDIRASTKSQSKLAKEYGVGRQAIGKIIHRHNWKHI